MFDHGFLYGEGVYETLRTYNGQPFLFDRHMRRLRKSAGMLALDVPLTDAADRRALSRHDARGRPRRQPGARGLHPHPGHPRHRRAHLRSGRLARRRRSSSSSSRTSIRRRTSSSAASRSSLVAVVRNHPGSVNPLIKSNNLLNNALAMQEAFRRGGFEGVMRNYKGELAECTQSNLFIVKNGAALTPPIDAGLLPGITREFLFEVGAEIGIPVREQVLRDDDLFGADECVPHQHDARGRADRAGRRSQRSGRASPGRSRGRCSTATGKKRRP